MTIQVTALYLTAALCHVTKYYQKQKKTTENSIKTKRNLIFPSRFRTNPQENFPGRGHPRAKTKKGDRKRGIHAENKDNTRAQEEEQTRVRGRTLRSSSLERRGMLLRRDCWPSGLRVWLHLRNQ